MTIRRPSLYAFDRTRTELVPGSREGTVARSTRKVVLVVMLALVTVGAAADDLGSFLGTTDYEVLARCIDVDDGLSLCIAFIPFSDESVDYDDPFAAFTSNRFVVFEGEPDNATIHLETDGGAIWNRLGELLHDPSWVSSDLLAWTIVISEDFPDNDDGLQFLSVGREHNSEGPRVVWDREKSAFALWWFADE